MTRGFPGEVVFFPRQPRNNDFMTRIQGFPPVASASAHTLILGSMPGQASLRAGQYYAHPRNAFWPIVSELLGVTAGASYAARTRALKSAGFALWDVLQSCQRQGSLDAHIQPQSGTVNDFQQFLRAHRRVARIYFNGATAETMFTRRVLPALDGVCARLIRLPSTSPAHAALSFAEKLEAWRDILPPERQ
jgi:hypoxanthine-DNA glycosylase